MDGYFIHLNSSTLKIGLYNAKENPKFITEDLLPTAVSHSKIVDGVEFCREFSKILTQNLGSKPPKLPLYFVLEPELTELFLLTTNKNVEDQEQFLTQQIKDRLVDEDINNLYFTYFKIAPFVYQFAGIKKDTVQTILETANTLGLELGGVFPLGLILAKTTSDISSMFVFPRKNDNTAVFSELTGVLFAEKFTEKIALPELTELFWKLSVYNNKENKLNIYSFPQFAHSFGSHKILILGEGELQESFEEIAVTHKVLTANQNVIESQANLLNTLPTPQVQERRFAPATVTASALSVLLVAGLIVQLTIGFNNIFSKISSDQKQDVLANQDQAVQPETQEPPKQEEPKKELKRTDLKIRVENGNGVAGSAGKLQTYLEGFGYTVVSIGNANNANYTKTTIVLPKDFRDYSDLLSNDLKTNYSVEVSPTDTKSSDYDVLIIVGQS